MKKNNLKIKNILVCFLAAMLTLCSAACGNNSTSSMNKKSKTTTSTAATWDTSIASGYYSSIGALKEAIKINGEDRANQEVTIINGKIQLPNGEIKAITLDSWSRKITNFPKPEKDFLPYIKALEKAKVTQTFPKDILLPDKKIPIELHFVLLTENRKYRDVSISNLGDGYHQISIAKDNKDNFSKTVPIQSEKDARYESLFIKSDSMEKMIKGWINWEKEGKTAFHKIKSVKLSTMEKRDAVTLNQEQINRLKTYLKVAKKELSQPCSEDYYFEATLENGKKFHFSISGDGDFISTDRGVYSLNSKKGEKLYKFIRKMLL